MKPEDFRLEDIADYTPVLDGRRKLRGQISYHEQSLNPLLEMHPELERYVAEEVINVLKVMERNSGIILSPEQKTLLLSHLAGMFYEGFFVGKVIQTEIDKK